MTSVVEIQCILLGAGVFTGMAAAGMSAGRLFMRAARSVLVLPGQMERCAVALEQCVSAMEAQNALDKSVVELRELLVATRDELNRDKADHDHVRREIRILTRRMAGEHIHGQTAD